MTHSSEIHVFRADEEVGAFRRSTQGYVDFSYEDGVKAPISLSLPIAGGPHNSRQAQSFLDNLLPDNPQVRRAWAKTLDVPNTPFDLVREMGEDVAGALVLLPDRRRPDLRSAPPIPISRDEIADRIAKLTRDPDSWLSADRIGQERMSLAGAQGKFALARIVRRGESGTTAQWYLPSASVPSTHILKPPASMFPEAAELETGSLMLARRIGIQAPDARVVDVLGQRSYIVGRFDREVMPTGIARRVHVEDLAQALGVAPRQKETITAQSVISLLKRHTSEEDCYAFVRMLAFNAAIGNGDAHGKNYSLVLDGDRPRLAPLYDALPTAVWPDLLDTMVMKVGDAAVAAELTVKHWRGLALGAGIDADRTAAIAVETNKAVVERAHDVYRDAGVSPKMLGRVDRLVGRMTGGMVRSALA